MLFSQWPVLGAAVRSFLHHHKEPHLIAEKPFWLFVNEMSLPVAFVGWTQSLYFYSVGASSAWFAFIFLYFPASQLMMFSHRWAHMKSSNVPHVGRLLRWSGIIMKRDHHQEHHRTYDCNFAIFSGVSNILMNPIMNRTSLDRIQTSQVWLAILLVFLFSPAVVYFVVVAT